MNEETKEPCAIDSKWVRKYIMCTCGTTLRPKLEKAAYIQSLFRCRGCQRPYRLPMVNSSRPEYVLTKIVYEALCNIPPEVRRGERIMFTYSSIYPQILKLVDLKLESTIATKTMRKLREGARRDAENVESRKDKILGITVEDFLLKNEEE